MIIVFFFFPIINTTTNTTQTATGKSGRVYGSPTARAICNLSSLTIGTEYEVLEKENKPTRFGSYIVTVVDEDDNTFMVYMPEYIARYAEKDKWFEYQGLQHKKDNTGHTFHKVLWEK